LSLGSIILCRNSPDDADNCAASVLPTAPPHVADEVSLGLLWRHASDVIKTKERRENLMGYSIIQMLLVPLYCE
jgi:hypothetical protein